MTGVFINGNRLDPPSASVPNASCSSIVVTVATRGGKIKQVRHSSGDACCSLQVTLLASLHSKRLHSPQNQPRSPATMESKVMPPESRSIPTPSA